MRKIKESFTYDDLLAHVKHAEEYKNDPRCQTEAQNLITAIKSFGIMYNAIADNLANSKAGETTSSDNIVGFVNKEGNYVKYDKSNQDYVVYNPRSPKLKTKTLHKKSIENFNKIVLRDFLEELPENKH